jgi:hypothetical protein
MTRLKFGIVLGLATLLLGAPGVARASHSQSGGNPPRDFAVGHGQIAGPRVFTFSIAAQSGPLGKDPHGHYRVEFLDGQDFSGQVTCFIALGNVAILSGPLQESPGDSGFVAVIDVGDSRDEMTIDKAGFQSGPLPATREGCLTAAALFPGVQVVEHGNVTVHDGQPDMGG